MNSANSRTWINISVFYEKTSWTQLISGFLQPYILKNKELGNIGLLIISLNSAQGDNIRFAFDCITNDKERFADDFHFQLTRYLKDNPSENPSQNYKRNKIFMDFPNNSIQYNLYDHFINHDQITEFQLLISEIILNVFAEKEYNELSVFTLVLYLTMFFCNLWEKIYGENTILKLSAIQKSNPQALNDNVRRSYDNFFDENKALVMGLYKQALDMDQDSFFNANLIPLKDFYSNLLMNSDKNRNLKYTLCMPFDGVLANQVNFAGDMLPSIYSTISSCANFS